jgi:hypothetical protein
MTGPGERTRLDLHRVAAHVVARARAEVTGRIGLRATPGGFGTPEFGPDPSRVRVAGARLFHETASSTPSTRSMSIDGASLDEIARFAGVELAPEFSVGRDTPPLGDVDEPMQIDPGASERIGRWFDLTARALDLVVGSLPPFAAPTVAQLWPEHFDLALDVAFDESSPADRRANLGGSAGDGFHAEPYLYVGPWTPDRPGDPSFWNAPFGAVLGADEVLGAGDPVGLAARFMRNGLSRLAS